MKNDERTGVDVERAYSHLAPSPELRAEVLDRLPDRVAPRRTGRRVRLLAAAAALVASALLVHRALPPAADPGEEVDVEEIGPLVHANNSFALDLLREITRRTGDVALAPHSVLRTLVMLREGASPSGKRTIDGALGLPEADLPAAWAAFAAALRLEKTETESDERVWLSSGLAPGPEYQRVLAGRWGAHLGRVDFGDPDAARETLNGRAAAGTFFRVKEVVAPHGLSSRVRLAATSAMDFRGALGGGRRVGAFLYAGGRAGRLADLTYRGGEVALTVLLPADDDDRALIDDLRAKELARWIAAAEARPLVVRIPDFSVTTRLDLSPLLPAMGLGVVADPESADLRGISPARPLALDRLWHGTAFSLDRRGTDARVPTGGGEPVVKDALPPGAGERPVEFAPEGPFVFVLRHVGTGTILLLGRASP